mgnify:CR=1 FL=1|tara:strand:+ start:1059 stop:1991 length:933 start_codon:yes stop_codon:yes gene_type:complete
MADLYVNVNGTWKTASNYYVNVNGTWKEGSNLYAKVSSAWKESGAVTPPSLTFVDHYYDAGTLGTSNETRNVSSDSGANETWGNIPTVTTAGKRLFVVIVALRQASTNTAATWLDRFDNHYTLNLKYNSTTTALTRRIYAATKFNSTSIWTVMADGATSATDDYSIQLISDDGTDHGNYGYSVIVLDNVNNIEYVNSIATAFSTSDDDDTSSFSIAPNNTTNATKLLRVVAGNASNIATDAIDYIRSNNSESTYTVIGEGDNGTNERHHHAYVFEDHASPNLDNLAGKFGTTASTAGDGMSGCAVIIGLS